MKEFAEIKDGKVVRVIVCDSLEWCEQRLGGEWVERKTPAGIGYTYDKVKDAFAAPNVESKTLQMTANGTVTGDVKLG